MGLRVDEVWVFCFRLYIERGFFVEVGGLVLFGGCVGVGFIVWVSRGGWGKL